MQMLLKGGSTRNFTLTPTPVYFPITSPIVATGTEIVSAQVQIPAGLHADVRAMLVYRYFLTDDSMSAGNWVDVDTSQNGPGKAFKQGTIASVTGLMIQLGLKMYTSTGTQVGRGLLGYPVVVTK